MNKKLPEVLLAITIIGFSSQAVSDFSIYETDKTEKNSVFKTIASNTEQQQNIESKYKGYGEYLYPYNYYNPRHIRNKKRLQQIGNETDDKTLDQLTEYEETVTEPEKKNTHKTTTQSLKKQKTHKEYSFVYPMNFQHPKFKSVKKVKSNRFGELRHVLNVQYGEHEFYTLQQGYEVVKNLRLRGYGGDLTGPTLIARPGDTLKIRLNNFLPPESHRNSCDHDADNCDPNIPHGFNNTNLHTHGLHVDPSGNSDNVFVKLESGDSFEYEIKIPEDHVAGTFWYHAHVHGSTSVQVASGVHGALIIRGDYDKVPEIKKAKERIMILQTIPFDKDGEIKDNTNFFVEKWHPQGWQRGWHYSINGQVMPEIVIRPGSTELWRFIHAGIREYSNLQLINPCDRSYDIPLVQLAADGIPFPKKRLSADKGVFLAPGNRGDVMVKPKRRGVYYLVDTSVKDAADLPDSYCDTTRTNKRFLLDEKAQNIIARVTVKGERKKMQLPRNKQLKALNRPASIKDSELSNKIEYTVFNITPKDGIDPNNPDQFSGENYSHTINGKEYDPSQSRRLKFGTAQTWKLSSEFFFHPYHIHVNPFEVITRNETGKIIDRYWRDTIMVWPADVGQDPATSQVEIRTRYEDYVGSFVMHCHILDHEDRGMMEKVTIHH